MTPYKVNGRQKKWAINVPARFSENNKRTRLFYKTEEIAALEAKKLKNKILKHGRGAPRFTAGHSERLQELIDLAGGLDQMESIVRDHVKRLPSMESRTVGATVKEFHATKEFEGIGILQKKSLRNLLGYFDRAYSERQLSSLSSGEVESWLVRVHGQDPLTSRPRPITNQSKKNIHRALTQFFGWCERREYISKNIMRAVTSPKPESPRKEIFTPEQMERMINGYTDPKTKKKFEGATGEELVYLALGGYAGLRTAEIEGNIDHEGMRWEWIDFERGEILIPKEVTKKSRERLVPLNDTARVLLLRAGDKKRGAMITLSDRQKRNMREKLAKAAGMAKWLDNALRHSFASYHLAKHEDAAKTSLLIGHKDAETTHRHYARLVRKDEAEKWFCLR